ncbi:MAG: PAS domain S-box protein [Trueperaceae bacterium]|nr:PAS domain S-box protein [Trueperaceae bacterium]
MFNETTNQNARQDDARDDIRDLLASLELPVLILDGTLRVLRSSPSIADVVAVPISKGDELAALAAPLGDPSLVEAARRVRDSRTAGGLELISSAGRRYQTRLLPHQGHDGIVITLTDVTDQQPPSKTPGKTSSKTPGKTQPDDERRYKTLFESVDEGFCLFEIILDDAGKPVDYRFLETNPAFERNTGLTDAEGKTALELVPNLEDYWIETYGQVALSGESTHFTEHSAALGRWFDVTALRVGNPGDHQVMLFFKDITEQKNAEDALRESEQKLQRLFRQAPAIITIHEGPEHIYTFTNTFHDQVLGERVYLGRSLRDAVPELAGQGTFERFDHVYLSGEPIYVSELEAAFDRDGDGKLEEGHFSQVLQPWFGADGNIAGVMSFSFEITEQVEAREAQRRLNDTLEEQVEARTTQVRDLAARLSMAEQHERARIARVIHDDIQQLLHALQLRCKLIAKKSDAPAVVAHVREAEEILQQIVSTTRSLMVEVNPPVLRDEGLGEAFDWLATHMRRQHGFKVELSTDLGAADSLDDSLDNNRQVMLFHSVRELLFNAVKHAGVDRANLIARAEDGHVKVIISDEGVGFNLDEALAKSKQSFGLANIRERLELSGGTLSVDSVPGDGTYIVLTLPVAL